MIVKSGYKFLQFFSTYRHLHSKQFICKNCINKFGAIKWVFISDNFSYRIVGFEGYFNKIFLNNLVNKIVSFPT